MDDWRHISDLAVGVLLKTALKAMKAAAERTNAAHAASGGKVVSGTYRVVGEEREVSAPNEELGTGHVGDAWGPCPALAGRLTIAAGSEMANECGGRAPAPNSGVMSLRALPLHASARHRPIPRRWLEREGLQFHRRDDADAR